MNNQKIELRIDLTPKSLGLKPRSLERLWSKLLDEFSISHSKDRWVNKKYKREFFGIRIRKGEIDNFLKILPLQNKEKLGRIQTRFKCGDAGVAKRDRGLLKTVQA